MGESAMIGAAIGLLCGIGLSVSYVALNYLAASTAPPHQWGILYDSAEEYAAAAIRWGVRRTIPFGAISGAALGATIGTLKSALS